MCGIIGYSGSRAATPILLESLRRLEYRGYDSAGIAVVDGHNGGTTTVVKSDRKVADLTATVELDGVPEGHVGIGHTRWATHGRPTVVNAHPHQDCSGRLHLIHNGIIENYRELRAELTARGHQFTSDTDTEVVPHLVEEAYAGDLAAAVRTALQRIEGAYALVVVHADEPTRIVGARLNAPLVVGVGDHEVFVSSDITALIPYTTKIVLIGDGEVVAATADGFEVTSIGGDRVVPTIMTVDWKAEQAERGGYPHFLLKEIYEQPDALRNALRGRIDDAGLVRFAEMGVSDAVLKAVTSVRVVACGTALIAGLVLKSAMEELARLPVTVDVASEFRYSSPIVDQHTLVVAISQSGETADTLAAVREARQRGAPVIAIANVVGSALSRDADGVIYMQAGPEISVCATKTFIAQIACGLLLALHTAGVRGAIEAGEHRRFTTELTEMPEKIVRALELEPLIAEMAQRYAHASDAIYIARGVNVAVALEGALKLKEVAYVHAEGYPAGELKHGPIALLDEHVPVVAVATRSNTLAKLVSNVQEVRARAAPVIAIVTDGENPFDEGTARDVLAVPACRELLSPLVTAVPLQLFAYHMAVERGCDVDQPRNLAKSVTVE